MGHAPIARGASLSWLQRLNETYEACFGLPQFAQRPLTPIDHVEQQAHIEVTLDEHGSFLRASVVPKEPTLIPATERSAGRTSGVVAHPLCDKLRYIARLEPDSEEHRAYLEQLRSWVAHSPVPSLLAILSYVESGSIVRDLLAAGVLIAAADGSLETRWSSGLSPLAKLLIPDARTKERDQGDALIRWRVEIPGELETAVWKDVALQLHWAAFNASLGSNSGLCLCTGTVEPLAMSHPRRLRHGGDGAKLISSNDNANYTFRGRFTKADEAYGLSSSSTQRAHNALRWLIARQGMKNGDQVVVAWAVHGQAVPRITDNSYAFLNEEDDEAPMAAQPATKPTSPAGYEGDAGQLFARQLNTRMQGYSARLSNRDNVVVMALDSATPGRMAVLYYRELRGSEFLDRIERWHMALAWPQFYGKEMRFIGAPAPREIAEAAYGRRVDEKLSKATVERLLPCILDGRPLPRDLQEAVFRRAIQRGALDWWEFERVLGIACSLTRAIHPERNYRMSLEEDRHTRDYLYGRLLAIADSIEEISLNVAGESRETNAARLMQRFADHPATTWRTLELQLRPYMSRLRASRYAGALIIRERLMDQIIISFPRSDEGGNTFLDNRPLSGEFLLGFHSQREELRRRKTSDTSTVSEGEEH